jgi:hypothetical protein
MKIKIVTFFACILLLMSCQDMFDPENENISSFDRVYTDPGFAEGLLISAYARIPTNSLSFNDVATDDAVTNDKNNGYLRMATGEWSALYNPVNQWTNANTAVIYLDQLINIIDSVEWKWSNSEIKSLYVKRFYGEAYALKGVIQYHLLQTVAGYDEAGNLLGIPFYKDDKNFNIPRATFEESVNQIYSDFNKALEYLTMDDYQDIGSASELPTGYAGVNIDNYNEVFGKELNQRISGRIVKAYKARLALLAASPAFSPNNDAALWQNAANYAGQVLSSIGGVSGLDPNGHRFYDAALVDGINLASGADSKEIIWRRSITASNSRELSNFPPSLFGQGNVNPTQNIVEAFPMANGFPIKHSSSGYDPENPYASRDPRLSLYIVYNGGTISGQKIYTGVGGGQNARDSISTSTRTGYYLKKLLREDVNLDPTSINTKKHYEVHMRYTELFLIFAEAANEAWGPDGTGSFSFSARDVIAAIRKRAGIAQPDAYLASITTKEQMRELIRNERRLELCFEGFRFWDLRRWKSDLTETAKGININGNSMTVIDVENRLYDNDFMHYGPLPKNELTKFDALIQNRGW